MTLSIVFNCSIIKFTQTYRFKCFSCKIAQGQRTRKGQAARESSSRLWDLVCSFHLCHSLDLWSLYLTAHLQPRPADCTRTVSLTLLLSKFSRTPAQCSTTPHGRLSVRAPETPAKGIHSYQQPVTREVRPAAKG